MNKSLHFLFLFSCINLALADADHVASQLLSAEEALEIVEQREAAKEARYQALKQEIASAQVVQSTEVQRGGRPITINLIKPLVLEKPAPAEPTASDTQTEMTPEQWAAYIESQQALIPEYISMGANVYGDEYSKITWRDQETKLSLVVWTNISLRYLRFADSFESEGVRYDYLGLPTTVYTREGEAARIRFAQEYAEKHGIKIPEGIASIWEEPPYPFTDGQYEYYVMADDPAQVPEKLYRQMNAVLGYYVSELPRLKIEHLNSETMEKARAKFLEKNPPVPQPTVINFWKIEN